MADLSHWFGNDLSVGASGDLLTADEPLRSEQRLVRRLLTNPGDYVWHPRYGAGLASYIGQPTAPKIIEAITRAQVRLEASIARSPAPEIAVTAYATGVATVVIKYWNVDVGGFRTLSFNVISPNGDARAN